jgi:hypothetical protein
MLLDLHVGGKRSLGEEAGLEGKDVVLQPGPGAASAELLENSIPNGGEEIDPETAMDGPALTVLPNRDEDPLDGVFRLIGIARQLERKLIELAVISTENLLERGGITGTDTGDPSTLDTGAGRPVAVGGSTLRPAQRL